MNTASTPLSANTAGTSSDAKTIAIVSYLTLIGFVAALIMHGSKKTELGAFHLRQMLGLTLTSIALSFAWMILAFIPIIGWLVGFGLWAALIALWFTGLMSAVRGEAKPVALVGEHYQQWFRSAFA